MNFNWEEMCFEFEHGGFWRIYTDRIEYLRYEINRGLEDDYGLMTPVNPDDYWWFEKAKRQTGDYGAGNAVNISEAKVGSIITMGKFEMDNNTDNGSDTITWRVIDEKADRFLLISEYCISKQKTSSSYSTWENSISRKWLNETFYNDAFTQEEQDKIILSKIVNEDNTDTGTEGGNNTDDYLFLLSIDEVNKYFATDEERIAYGTLYVQELTDEDEDEFCWWLRTPGEIHVGLESDSIKQCYVGSQGFVYTEGESTCVYNVAVRPAMWVLK